MRNAASWGHARQESVMPRGARTARAVIVMGSIVVHDGQLGMIWVVKNVDDVSVSPLPNDRRLIVRRERVRLAFLRSYGVPKHREGAIRSFDDPPLRDHTSCSYAALAQTRAKACPMSELHRARQSRPEECGGGDDAEHDPRNAPARERRRDRAAEEEEDDK